MVKRTLVVLGVVSLMVMMAGGASAQLCNTPCFGADLCAPPPLFVPVDCPGPIQKTIVKKWECKIVGPCPPASPPAACGNSKDDTQGLLLSLVTAIASPFDLLMAPDGVYGCMPNGDCSPCGTCMPGPLPKLLTAFTGSGCGGTGLSFFGGLW